MDRLVAQPESLGDSRPRLEPRRGEGGSADGLVLAIHGVERATIVADRFPKPGDEKISEVRNQRAVHSRIDKQRIQFEKTSPRIRCLPSDREMRRENLFVNRRGLPELRFRCSAQCLEARACGLDTGRVAFA